jgi:hypothetical protein
MALASGSAISSRSQSGSRRASQRQWWPDRAECFRRTCQSRCTGPSSHTRHRRRPAKKKKKIQPKASEERARKKENDAKAVQRWTKRNCKCERHCNDRWLDAMQQRQQCAREKEKKKKKKMNFSHLLAVDRARIGTNAQVLDAANNDTGRKGRARVVEERREAGTFTVLEREVLRRPHRTVVADDGRASHALGAHQLIVNVCLPRHVFVVSLYCVQRTKKRKKKSTEKLIFFFFFCKDIAEWCVACMNVRSQSRSQDKTQRETTGTNAKRNEKTKLTFAQTLELNAEAVRRSDEKERESGNDEKASPSK